uniref:G-protein coupled receptors family 1 profile domain-containing protein n=1 Tax=Panagrolaimus davidi TaxID=227884 RepID=A0A914QG27_9BILA
MTKCAILNGIVWVYNVIFSVTIGIYGSTLIYPEESKVNCEYKKCQKPLAIFVTVLLGVSYFVVIIAYFGSLIKVTIVTAKSQENATHQNTKNVAIMRRFLYNIIIFALTKIPLLIICGFILSDLDNLKDLGKGEETSCKKFLHGKLYFKVELIASITVFVTLLGT